MCINNNIILIPLNSYTTKFLAITLSIVLYYNIISICARLFSDIYLLKSTKLYDNDSLALLYILSSPIYTILFLFILIFFIRRKLNLITYSMFFICLLGKMYFLCYIRHHNYALTFLQNSGINNTLQNGLLNIHPILIYYMYATFIYLVFYLYEYGHKNRFVTTASYIYKIVVCSLLGMYLGALWASQELNWGGFWSWDPVEIISLLATLFSIKILHNKNSKILNKTFFINIITVWLVYVIIRLGVINTIHSFIRSSNIAFYIPAVIICIKLYFTRYIIYSSILLIYLTKNYFVFKIQRLQISCIYLYTYTFIIYLITYNNSPVHMFNLSAFLFFAFLLTSIFLKNFFFVKINLWLIWYTIFILILISYVMDLKYFFIFSIIFYLYLSNTLFVYSPLHLLLYYVYIVYFVFMCNIPIYNLLTQYIYYSYNLNNLSIIKTQSFFYELNFFLKKQFFLTKLKGFVIHINGFGIVSNGWSSLYIFCKNFWPKALFVIEYIYICIFIIFMLYFGYIRIVYLDLIKSLKIHY